MGIKIESAAYSSIGGRKNNEDNFYLNGAFLKREQMDRGGKVSSVNAQSTQVYAVFDGMGGGDYGEFASFYAASCLKDYQENSEHVDHSENLRKFLTKTSIGIDKISEEHGLRSGSCGSTCAMLVVGDWWYRTAHVGDSRVYLLRNGELFRLTKDQSEVQRMVDAGQITMDEAWSHPKKNIITHHLGMPLRTGELKSIIGERMPLQVGDCFLICSDGVSDSLRDRDIKALFSEKDSAENNAATIAQNAKKAADEMNAGDVLTVLVDNEIAVQNLQRFATGKGYGASSEKKSEIEYAVTIRIAALAESKEEASEEEEVVCAVDARKKGMLVVLSANVMGKGEEKLGKALMKAFVFALTKQDQLPETILCYNTGAYLTCEGADTLEDLKSMEAEGVTVLTCGTCLDFYGIKDKLAVGSVTNMYDIVERMEAAKTIVRP